MRQENRDELLKQHLTNLKRESRRAWHEVVTELDGALARLPEEPTYEDMKEMTHEVGGLLEHYRYGRKVLDIISAMVDDEPDDSESYGQKKNRLRELIEQVEKSEEESSGAGEAAAAEAEG